MCSLFGSNTKTIIIVALLAFIFLNIFSFTVFNSNTRCTISNAIIYFINVQKMNIYTYHCKC